MFHLAPHNYNAKYTCGFSSETNAALYDMKIFTACNNFSNEIWIIFLKFVSFSFAAFIYRTLLINIVIVHAKIQLFFTINVKSLIAWSKAKKARKYWIDALLGW